MKKLGAWFSLVLILVMTASAFGSSSRATEADSLVTVDGTKSWVPPFLAHLLFRQTSPPSATVNANAGTGATCTLTSGATDGAGEVTLVTTAVAGSSGAECAVTFNTAFTYAPICVFSAGDNSAGLFSVAQGIFVTTSTTALTFNFSNTDLVGRTYIFAYHCIETH